MKRQIARCVAIFILIVVTCSELNFQNITRNGTLNSELKTSATTYINIVCPDYIAGTKQVDVYSTVDISTYSLLLDGSVLNSISTPSQGHYGHWNATYLQVIRGAGVTGNISSLEKVDKKYFYVHSADIGNSEYINVEVSFSAYELGFPISQLNFTNLVFSINGYSLDGLVETRSLQYYNTLTSTWTSFYTLASSGTSTGNVSVNAKNNIRSFTNDFVVRFNMIDTNNNKWFTINASYFYMFYNQTIPQVNDGYNLIDSYSLNSLSYADGIHNLTVIINGYSAGSSLSKFSIMKWIVIDNTAPIVNNITLTPGSGFTSINPINIHTTVSDTYLYYDYGQYANSFANVLRYDNGNNQIFDFNSLFTNGSYNFYVFAYDLAGNSAMKNKTFTVQLSLKNVYSPSFNIGYSVIGRNVSWNIWSNNTSSIKLNIDSVLNSTISGNTSTTINYTKLALGTRRFDFLIYDPYSILYKNYSIKIVIDNIPIKTVYVYSPSFNIGYSVVGRNVSWNVWSNNTSSIKLNFDGVLNNTIAGNTSKTINYTKLSLGTHRFDFLIYDPFSVLYKNHSISILINNLPSAKIIYDPSFTISASVSFRNASLKVWSNNTSLVKINLDKVLNDTVVGNTSKTINYTKLTIGTRQFDFLIYDPFSVLYKNYSMKIVIEDQPPLKKIYLPIFTVSYPQFIIADTTGSINAKAINSTGFKLTLRINNIINSTRFYAGNVSQFINVTSKHAGDVLNFSFNIMDTSNKSYVNTSFVIDVESVSNFGETISVDYTSMVYEHAYITIAGTITHSSNVSIYLFGNIDYAKNNTKNFNYTLIADMLEKSLNFTVKIEQNATLIYRRDFTVNVVKQIAQVVEIQPPSPLPPSPSTPDTENNQLFFYVIIGVLVGGAVMFLIIPITQFINSRGTKRDPGKSKNMINSNRRRQ